MRVRAALALLALASVGRAEPPGDAYAAQVAAFQKTLPLVRKLDERFAALTGKSDATATEWATLAREAQRAKRADYATRAALRAIAADPGQRDARAVLGHELVGERWLPAWHAKRLRTEAWIDHGGWIPTKDLPKVEQGLLPLRDAWLPAPEVRARRSEWTEAWEIPWGPWLIRTDIPIEDVPRLGALLDHAEQHARACFGGHFGPPVGAPIVAQVFRAKATYDAEIDLKHEGAIGWKRMAGFYSGDDRSLHLTWHPTRPADTIRILVHEATHALCLCAVPDDEARGTSPTTFADEIVAVYAEDGSEVARAAVGAAGGWGPRVAEVVRRQRLTLQRLLTLAMNDPSAPPHDVTYPYALAVGWFAWREGDATRREAFHVYVRLHHSRRAEPDLLPALLGTTWDALEADWAAFLDRVAAAK